VDLRLLDAEPTTEERAAIDAFLGPPVSSWAGANAVEDGHSAHGGHAARAQRQQLLPTLHALNQRTGWISLGAQLRRAPADRSTGRRLRCGDLLRAVLGAAATASDVARVQRPGVPLRRLGEAARGAERANRLARLRPWRCHLGAEPVPGSVRPGAGRVPRPVRRGPDRAGADQRRRAGADRNPERRPPGIAAIRHAPQAGQPALRLLQRIGVVDPESLDDYRAHGDIRPFAGRSTWVPRA